MCTPTTAMTHFISVMAGGNVTRYQPKLVIGLVGIYRSSPPKAEVRGSNPLECAILIDVINGLTRTGHLSAPCHV